MTAAASFSVRIDLSLNSSQMAMIRPSPRPTPRPPAANIGRFGKLGESGRAGGGDNVHLLALLLVLHAGAQLGGALLGQQIFVEGLGVIVVAGEQLVLLLDVRAHGGAALVNVDRLCSLFWSSVACSITL